MSFCFVHYLRNSKNKVQLSHKGVLDFERPGPKMKGVVFLGGEWRGLCNRAIVGHVALTFLLDASFVGTKEAAVNPRMSQSEGVF